MSHFTFTSYDFFPEVPQEMFDCMKKSCWQRAQDDACSDYPYGCPAMKGYIPTRKMVSVFF